MLSTLAGGELERGKKKEVEKIAAVEGGKESVRRQGDPE